MRANHKNHQIRVEVVHSIAVYPHQQERLAESERDWCTFEPAIFSPWTKWTNNVDYLNKGCPKFEQMVMTALSHFSYHVSKGAFLQVDLQGSFSNDHFILSDPTFCTSLASGAFMGPTDMGAKAVNEFFTKIHPECNEFCDPQWRRPDQALRSYLPDSGSESEKSTKSHSSKSTSAANFINLCKNE